MAEIGESCTGCGECVGLGGFCGLSLDEDGETGVVDVEKCIGCGVCEDKWPTGDVTLRKDPSKGKQLDLALLM